MRDEDLRRNLAQEQWANKFKEEKAWPCTRCGGTHPPIEMCPPPEFSRSDSDPVNSPDHYTWHPAGVECISIIEVFPHNIAAAMGYLWRHDHKGEPIQDLRKAVWHIEREIKRRGGE
jgi:hypothetical protein